MFNKIQQNMTERQHWKSRTIETVKNAALFGIAGYMIAWWMAKGYVNMSGGVWPKTSTFEWFIDLLGTTGVLGFIVGILGLIGKIFFSKRKG